MYDLSHIHLYSSPSTGLHGQIPDGLTAHLVKHGIGIAEVIGLNTVQARKIHTKPHPRLEWRIFHILTSEYIDELTDIKFVS